MSFLPLLFFATPSLPGGADFAARVQGALASTPMGVPVAISAAALLLILVVRASCSAFRASSHILEATLVTILLLGAACAIIDWIKYYEGAGQRQKGGGGGDDNEDPLSILPQDSILRTAAAFASRSLDFARRTFTTAAGSGSDDERKTD